MKDTQKAIQAIHRKLKSRNVEIIEVHHHYVHKKHELKRDGKTYRFGGFTTIVAIHDGKFPPITVTSFRSGYDKWDKEEGEFQALRKLVSSLPETKMRRGEKADFISFDEFNNLNIPTYRFYKMVKPCLEGELK